MVGGRGQGVVGGRGQGVVGIGVVGSGDSGVWG